MLLRTLWFWIFTWLVRTARGQQGDSYCGTTMCVRAFINGTQWTYQMQAYLGESEFGWMALGFGTTMSNADMVIMWPNRDGSVTLSQRAATGHTQPTVVQNPTRVATKYLQLSSQNADLTTLAFTVPPDTQTLQRLVWAVATIRPSSAAVDANLYQHVASGAISLDLSRTFSDNTVGTAVPTGPPGSGSNTYLPPFPTQSSGSGRPVFQLPALLPYQQLLMAHAILSAVGFLIILPTGALLARWARTFTDKWFMAHWIFQAVFGIPIITAGWFLGVAGVIEKEGRHFDDTHKVLGLALFGAYILQLLLGVHIHLFKPTSLVKSRPIPGGTSKASFAQMITASNRPILNYCHAILGLSIIGLSFYQVYLGIVYEWERATGRGEAPPVTEKLWIAWAVLLPTFYFVGLALLPRQLRKERKISHTRIGGSDALPLKSSPPASKKTVRGVKISAPIPINEDEEWKRDAEDGGLDQDQITNGHELMSEDSHAPHSMQPVEYARAL